MQKPCQSNVFKNIYNKIHLKNIFDFLKMERFIINKKPLVKSFFIEKFLHEFLLKTLTKMAQFWR